MTEGLKARPEHNDDRMEAAVSSARQRLLEADQPQVSPAATSEQRFVEVPARGKQYRVPDPQWYSLTAEQKSRYLDAIDGAGQQEKDESVALQSVNQLLDLRDRDQVKARQEKAELLDVIAELTARVTALEGVDRSHEVKASQELSEAESRLSQTVVNAGAIQVSLDASAERLRVERDNTEQWFSNETQALVQPVKELRGTVESATTLMGERSNAIVDKVADAEGRQVRLGVTLTEMEGRTDAIGNPITRGEVEQFTRDAVQQELSGQVTDERIKQVVKENFIPAAPSTSIDALNLPDPQFAPVPGAGGN